MPDYNFRADLLDTFQSSSDWIKALWIVSVPAFLLGVLALVLRFRLAAKRLEVEGDGSPAYSPVGGETGGISIYIHDGADALNARRLSGPPALPKQASSDLSEPLA